MIDPNAFNINENSKQNRLEDILTPGEIVLTKITPNKKVFILEAIFKSLPIVLIWAGIDFAILFFMLKDGNFDPMLLAFLIPFFLLHLLPVWMYIPNVVKRVIEYKNVTYAFTDKRIIIRKGAIAINYQFFFYNEIQSVDVKVGFFDRLFKVGDLYLNAGTKSGVLEDISSPYQYSANLQKVMNDVKADLYYPNDLRPKENHGYNSKYEPKDK